MTTQPTQRLTSDRRRHSDAPSNNSLNPRRIQTGVPGLRRIVYDGALRVNSDAYDVLSGVVRDVHANTSASAVTLATADTNNSAAANNLSLQAKPEWRKHFPLNALLRPTTNSSTHDEFHIATTTAKKQRRSTVLVTELTNETVITHQPRIVNEMTGERAMCAVESVVTKGRDVEVAVLDLGEEHLEEEKNGQEAGGQQGDGGQEKEVVSIRGGGDGNEGDDGNHTGGGDVVMGEEGAAVVEKKQDDDVHMAEAPVNTAAAAVVEGGGGVAVDTTTTAADVTSTAAVDNTTVAATSTTAVAPSAVEGGSVDAVEAMPVETVASVPSAQSGGVADETKEVVTQQQQQPTAAAAVADTSTAVAVAATSTATTDDKSQEVAPPVNAAGEQGGGVADAPTSSSSTAQVDTNAAAVSAPDVASAPTANSSAPAAAAATTTTTAPTSEAEATTVKSTTIHPLPSNHPPLSTSILPTTTTIITPPQNAPSWYHPTTISTTEKSSLPEWFNSSAPHRTSTTYLSTRNQILNIYHAQLSSSSNMTAADTTTTAAAAVYLTPTAIRRCVPGDVGSLLRLHSFLCDWGLINGKDLGENTPSELALRGGSTTTTSSGGVRGKRKFQDEKRSVFWNKERLEQLDGVVVKYVRVTQTTVSAGGVEGAPQQQQHQLPSVDWDAVANDIGEGVSASDCQRAFLDPPKTDEVSAKIAKTSSSSGFDLSTILEDVHPDVLNATISASLKATNDITMARKASIAGILASTAATKAHSEEEEIARTFMDILDQRMQRLENRVAILDDVEALMEAERVALELERRDMYTTRCRHWFGDGSS